VQPTPTYLSIISTNNTTSNIGIVIGILAVLSVVVTMSTFQSKQSQAS